MSPEKHIGLGGCASTQSLHTDLVQSALVGEDGDVSIESSAAYKLESTVSIWLDLGDIDTMVIATSNV